jgi:hypothetical protein
LDPLNPSTRSFVEPVDAFDEMVWPSSFHNGNIKDGEHRAIVLKSPISRGLPNSYEDACSSMLVRAFDALPSTKKTGGLNQT